MSYFLKQSKLPKGTYLQIYEGHYDSKKGNAVNKCYKKLGYLEKLKSKEIPDPIAYYKVCVDKLNKKLIKENEEKKILLIGESPLKNFGYFLLKTMWNTIDLNEYMISMNYRSNFKYKIENIIQPLTYSRVIQPCSKLKTYLEVIPRLYEKYPFSLDQIYNSLEYIGEHYLDFIEIINYAINKKFSRNTSTSYFDCTNYYFEIDYEHDDLRKGPSKENRPNPIIGQALLLDGDGIPLGMKMYPGNENEHPKIREVINDLKKRNNINGKTIQVADKGLNSSDNIYEAIKDADGYIFSQSIKKLPDVEREWIVLGSGFKDVFGTNNEILYKVKSWVDYFPIKITKGNKKVEIKVKQKRVVTFNQKLKDKQIYEINKLVEKAKELNSYHAKKFEYGESSKYVLFKDENGKNAKTIINEDKINEDKKFAGYNLIVTSETNLKSEEIYKIYHNLWKIEESFKILKSELKSRPAHMQKKHSLYGHFLICYYSLVLLRLLEIKIFKEQYNSFDIINFVRDLNLIQSETQISNATKASSMITDIANRLKLDINHVFLTEKQVNKFFKVKFNIKNIAQEKTLKS